MVLPFLDEVQLYLKRGLNSEREPWPEREVIYPDAELKRNVRTLIDQMHLETINTVESSELKPLSTPQALRERAVNTWLLGPEGRRFIDLLHGHLLDEELAVGSVALRAALDRAAVARLRRHFNLPSAGPIDLEQKSWADRSVEKCASPWEDFIAYSEELGLSRRGITSPAGRVLTQLRGRDAVRWMLALEVNQATGPSDPWRLSAATVQALLAEPDRIVDSAHWEDYEREEIDFPHSWAVLRRLMRFGVLSIPNEPGVDRYLVHPEGIELLRELIAPESRFTGLARALLEEKLADVIAQREFSHRSDRRAAAWVVRSVAHSLRNALTPASFALDELEQAPKEVEADALAANLIARIRQGVDRAFKTVSDLVLLYQSSDAPAEPFDLGTAILDAIQRANGGGVDHELGTSKLQIIGHRLPLVQAMVELLQNSRQMGAKKVKVSARSDGKEVVVHVDDDGPGVPTHLRAKIFEMGFSTRPKGSGQGLALLKEVVEEEHSGSIIVADSPLGGARFSIHLPTG